MSWKFPNFGVPQPDPAHSNYSSASGQSWYPPPSAGPSPRSTSSSYSSSMSNQRASDQPPSPSHGQASPSEAAAEVIAILKTKNVDDIRKILSDKEAYQTFFNSLNQVKTQNIVRDELRKETLQLARANLEKEPRIVELRNQCMVIRTSELAAAQERLFDLERQKDEILSFSSPTAILRKLQDVMDQVDAESEQLNKKLLEKEIDLPGFVQGYKKLRLQYHRPALLSLATKTTL